MARLQEKRVGKPPKRIKAVAVYEDASTGDRVQEFCKSFCRDHGQHREMSKEMWLLLELRVARLREIAADEAARADLLIISVHHSASLPEEVQSWIDLWQKGESHASVLVALFDPVRLGDSTTMQVYLKEVARRGNMEFIVQSEER